MSGRAPTVRVIDDPAARPRIAHCSIGFASRCGVAVLPGLVVVAEPVLCHADSPAVKTRIADIAKPDPPASGSRLPIVDGDAERVRSLEEARVVAGELDLLTPGT